MVPLVLNLPSDCCLPPYSPTVNGADVDSIISSIAHEVSEAANDPTFQAW